MLVLLKVFLSICTITYVLFFTKMTDYLKKSIAKIAKQKSLFKQTNPEKYTYLINEVLWKLKSIIKVISDNWWEYQEILDIFTDNRFR